MTEVSSMATINIRSISPEDTVNIRHAILWPHVPRDSDIVRLAEDDSGLHFGAFLPEAGAEPVAVISLFHEDIPGSDDAASSSHKAWRFRKFACLTEYQGKGVGSQLLQHIIQHARDDLGAECIWCDARVTASEWYTRRGLSTFGDPFFKNGVEHIRMKIAV
ncbi:acyl-CoA N-acyltransferase [Peniophora sp. CONT]|nr:acyl-CoA N-acyltransferase [Peniophora sp. CONT]